MSVIDAIPGTYLRVWHGHCGEFSISLRCSVCLAEWSGAAELSALSHLGRTFAAQCSNCGQSSNYDEREKRHYAETNVKTRTPKIHTRRAGIDFAILGSVFDPSRYGTWKRQANGLSNAEIAKCTGDGSILAACSIGYKVVGGQGDPRAVALEFVIERGTFTGEATVAASDQELKSSGVIRSACQVYARTEKTERDWIHVHAWAIREFQQFDAATHERIVELAKESYNRACEWCKNGPEKPGTVSGKSQFPSALKG